MATKAQSAAVLRHAMEIAKGDDLERANHQFSQWSDDQLDAPYGQSGQTGREVWQSYKDNRAAHQAANDLLEEMLRAQGL